jgi:HlyD family secretion protein
MNSRNKYIIIAFVVAVLLTSLFYFYEEKKESDHLILYGNVDVRMVDLGFRVQGRLEKMYFEEGDAVKAGDVLAELDPLPYQQELNQADARVSSLSSSFNNVNSLFKRREQLISTNSVSQQEYDDSLFNRDTTQSNLKEAEAAQANAKIRLDDTKIICLESGTVLTRVREPGTVVKVADPVYVVTILSPVWIRTYVNEPNLGKIYPGMEAEVYTDTKTNPVYKGKVGFISSMAEFTPKNVETKDLRTDLVYRLRVYVEDPTHGLLQGMPVTVKLKVK